MSTQRPWVRVKEPRDLPRVDGPGQLRDLDQQVFTEIVRDHLIPRSNDGKYTAQWRRTWNLISLDPQLADRAEDYLQDSIAETKAALQAGELTPEQEKRAHAYIDRAVMALDRIDRTSSDPLAWLGPRAADFNPRARSVIDRLVRAITEHRTDGDDARLYAVLTELGLEVDVRRRQRD